MFVLDGFEEDARVLEAGVGRVAALGLVPHPRAVRPSGVRVLVVGPARVPRQPDQDRARCVLGILVVAVVARLVHRLCDGRPYGGEVSLLARHAGSLVIGLVVDGDGGERVTSSIGCCLGVCRLDEVLEVARTGGTALSKGDEGKKMRENGAAKVKRPDVLMT